MKDTIKALGTFALIMIPWCIFAAWSERWNMSFHTRSIRERSEMRTRLDDMQRRLDRISERIDAALGVEK